MRGEPLPEAGSSELTDRGDHALDEGVLTRPGVKRWRQPCLAAAFSRALPWVLQALWE